MITRRELMEVVSYNPLTGIFRWNGTGIETAPSLSDGYRRVMVRGVRYKAHRLAWFYVTGEWPPEEIDHKDGNRANNAFENLRHANKTKNQWNRAANKGYEGRKGICFNTSEGKWRAQISIKGKRVHLGRFDNKDEAIRRYRQIAESQFGEYFRGPA